MVLGHGAPGQSPLCAVYCMLLRAVLPPMLCAAHDRNRSAGYRRDHREM